MSTKCLNCSAFLSCGCQKRVASDGKQVCSNCAISYETKLKQQKSVPPNSPANQTGHLAPKITGITVNMSPPK